ncbi:MAG: LURP-one-related family protein [Planctomycetaceae bacterium]|nr:LURP-one-related family protein [Planctomycetaceae bacterium]
MLYKIKEAFWSWGDDFNITDRNGETVFLVDGQAFSWGDKLSFQDADGRELAFISQTLLSWKPRFQILIDGEVFAEVVKEWTWFNQQFTLDVPGPNDYTINGSFWKHEFEFVRRGRVVARVSKNFWGWTDSYGVDIDDDEDVVAILCTCIVIDQVLHDGDDKK